MNTDITQAMCDDMDSTADFMHTTPPPFATIEHAVELPAPSPFNWRGTPSILAAQLRPQRIDRSTDQRHYCYPVEGQKAGEASFHRRQAIRLGGI